MRALLFLYNFSSLFLVIFSASVLFILSRCGPLFSPTRYSEFWINIEELKWGKKDDLTWTYWAPGEEALLDSKDCGMGHSDNNQYWTGEDCNSVQALPLCQIEGQPCLCYGI